MAKTSGTYRIGVDVGGTNTDAAIIDITAADSPSRGVSASYKTPTTVDVTSGIHTAIKNVLSKSQVDRKDVLSVAIGTTHFVNAVVEADARRLSKVAVVRLCGAFTRKVGASCQEGRDIGVPGRGDANHANSRFPRSSTSPRPSGRSWVGRYSTLTEVRQTI